MTQGILKSINSKDKLYKTLIRTPQNSLQYDTIKTNFKTFKNIIRKSIVEAKKAYYHKTFKKYSNDLRKTWQTINETLNRQNKKNKYPEEFNLTNGDTISDHKIIADTFNSFFTNIGETLNVHSNTTTNMFDQYLSNKPNCNLKFKTMTAADICQIINSLKPKPSSGNDNLSNRIIKFIKDVIIEPLTIIINQMLNTGIFPEKLKISKVVPLYKKDNKKTFSNYRPISLLPSISKIFERAIFLQLSDYFESNSLIERNQYGFRKQHSNELASLHIVDYINYQMDKMNTPINIYLDLSKAFDTLNHDVLLSKLKFYGINGIAYNLLSTYLCSRKQYVQFQETCSDLLDIKHGVPQGSIRGPLLFIIYINDFPNASNLFSFLMYADDTTLYCLE